MEIKKWYQSKTIWVNVLAGALAAITFVEGSDILPEHVTKALVSVILPVVNIALRFLTNKPILRSENPAPKLESCSGCPESCDTCKNK